MKEKYTFVSYSHKDKAFVEKEIEKRKASGEALWYDKSIEAGADWSKEISENLKNASTVLYFKSKDSEKSDNCKREITFAEDNNIPVETVKVPYKVNIYFVVAIVLLIAAILGYVFLSKDVPDVIGMVYNQGEEILTKAGFNTLIDYDYSDIYEPGYISDQNHKGITIGNSIKITESLGPERSLCMMPDTVGMYISDGIGVLVDKGFINFKITPIEIKNEEFGEITKQSLPAGYMVSCENTVELFVATDYEILEFEYDGRIIIVDNKGFSFSINDMEFAGFSLDEWNLFNENNHHKVFDEVYEKYTNVWLPAENAERILNNQNSCYGWVVVRDLELDAKDLFNGYREIYVCPGVTVTINGKTMDKDGFTDFYVAPGATLIFNDGIKGGANICNDGKTIVHGDYEAYKDELIAYNRGDFIVDGAYKGNLKYFSFKNSTNKGIDETNIKMNNYLFDGYQYYEGVTGPDGMFLLSEGLLKYNYYITAYDQEKDSTFGYSWCPIFKSEQVAIHEKNNENLFAYVILSDMEADENWNFYRKRNMTVEINVATGVTLTIPQIPNIDYMDIHIDKGAKVILNTDMDIYGDFGGELILFNLGELEINGNLIINSPYWYSHIVNCGSITGTGTVKGTVLNVLTFKGSTSTIDLSNVNGLYNYDYDPGFEVSGMEGSTSNHIWSFIHENNL